MLMHKMIQFLSQKINFIIFFSGKSVTYIVACVLVNEDNDVLMIQEAKKSCAGLWYLPAGRMEKGENIVEATIREVLEETGLHIRVTTLLAVESAGGSWFRFVLTGDVIGGELKTLAQADPESLQAKWISDLNEVSLRASDIVGLVDLGRSFKARGHQDNSWHKNLLPAYKAHYKSYLRIVVAIRKKSTNRVNILLSEKTAYHFPTVEIHPQRSIHSTLRKFMVELFGAEIPAHRPLGLLSVEHNPDQCTDPCCAVWLRRADVSAPRPVPAVPAPAIAAPRPD